MATKDGDIYMMGGLINSATVKGDLWLIEAGSGNMECYPLATTAEGPGPRVGHASLLVGNAFIVYGGDTKMDEGDTLDEALYLLNTSTRQWSRAIPGNPRPPGRYGHSLNILGSKVYVFGGQVEGFFMNDLVAFDLNQLQSPTNRWEFLIPNEAQGIAIPPPRTNHTIITYNDKLYLFGGTNGYIWFNDVWCYDPDTNSWSELPCIGYIPASREGHAAALVDDVMYIFGGRSDDGADLGDLAAFRISTRRWYTFQNMGPSPSPRSGHSMTAHGKQIVVLGGEPSTNTRENAELTYAFLLDTTKIRYPDKPQEPQALEAATNRRPSDPEKRIGGPPRNVPSREGMNAPPEQRRPNGAPPRMSMMGAQNMYRNDPNMPYMQGGPNSKLPRASMMQAPAGPPPPGMAPSRPTGPQGGNGPRGKPPVSNRGFGPAVDTVQRSASIERDQGTNSPVTNGRRTPQSATFPKSAMREVESGQQQRQDEQVQQQQQAVLQRTGSKSRRQQGSLDGTCDGQLKSVINRPGSPPAPTRTGSNPKPRSARNSQTVNLLNELDNLRNRNAWMTSELELARKAGYTPGGAPGSIIDNRISQSFGDSERPLVEALIAMRNELNNIQGTVDQQAVLTAKRIAEAEQQRDAAVEEAMYAKAKLNAQSTSGSQPGTPRDLSALSIHTNDDRSSEISKKLAAALQTQKDLHMHIDRLKTEIETEKRTRKLAEDTTNVAQARISELEKYKQNNTSEVESLKAELHQLQIEARSHAATSAEATSRAQLLEIEKEGLEAKLHDLSASGLDNNATFDSLRDALASSHNMKDILQRKLDEERALRLSLEEKLRALRTEHDTLTSELETSTKSLQDAEEMAEKHAAEAASLRSAVLSGLDRVASRSATSPTTSSDQLLGLKEQISNANALVRQYQTAANSASEKLRGAEERIAGLEAYQEQVSREGMSIRKQLQASMRDVQTLQGQNGEMKAKISEHSRETNALNIQYLTLKSLLGERGISPSAARGPLSPRGDSPSELNRVRQLEQELISAQNEHEETKVLNAAHLSEIETQYQEKLSQLESDYQSAVHYVKGTEKMLKRMKEDLSNASKVNAKLKAEVDAARERSESEGDWEEERTALRSQISNLQQEIEHARSEVESQLFALKAELEKSQKQRENDKNEHERSAKQMAESFEQARVDLVQLQTENELLEQRALDAEQKVSLLLDQVENSVDNYRRQSHLPASNAVASGSGASYVGGGHKRELSAVESIAESTYSDATARADDRNSMALDSLTNELESLRSDWEKRKDWRQSGVSTFTLETPGGEKDERENETGLKTPVSAGPGGGSLAGVMAGGAPKV